MAHLSVTIKRKNEIAKLITLGIKEIIVNLKDSSFSALRGFSVEEIVDIKKGLNEDVKLCVNMNALFSEGEIEAKQEEMSLLLNEGIDYIVVSDFGLLRKGQKMNKADKLIYDPITLMTNSLEAKTMADLGLGYIVISSLLTKEEIIDIAKNIDNASLIIHGHLLMSATKRKLLSEYAKEKDIVIDNDNLSIQEETRDALMPIYESEVGTLVYSDFIQESFRELNDFIEANIKRLVINTDYMSFEDVLETIKAYQRIISGEVGEEVEKEYKANINNNLLSDGYYGEKSIK